jgi:CelD/BcsL family acetyltransferase involved in cellulose biosynthesis
MSATATVPTPPVSRPQFALLDPAELDGDAVAAWRELAGDALEDNVFYAPELVLPAIELLQPGGVQLAVVADASGWLCALPVERRQVAGAITVPAYVGWAHAYGFLGAPLVRRGPSAQAAVDALVAGLLGRRGTAALILRRTRLDGPVHDLVAGALARAGGSWQALRPFGRPELQVGDALNLNAKRRSELRRLGRRLEEQLGPLTFDESASEDAVEAFLDLEDSGWKRERGSSLRAAGADGYVRGIVRELGARGAARLTVMRAGDRPVAAICDLVAGSTRFGFKVGYDESLARFSPGALLLAHESRAYLGDGEDPGAALRDGLTTWDSCVSSDRGLSVALWPRQRPIGTFVGAASGPLGSALSSAVPVAMRASGALRRSLRRSSRP